MARDIQYTYVFSAAAKTVTIAGLDPVRLHTIVNVTDGVTIYQANNSSLGGVFVGDVVTLDYDTTTMSDGDELQILYEGEASTYLASQVTLAAILAKLLAAPATEAKQDVLIAKDFATQTTLAALLAKVIAAPATEAKQDTGNTSLASILTGLGALPQVADLAVTGVAAAGTGVTVTLPAVSGEFHHITSIVIQMYASAARTGNATPTTVTSTNLPGSPAWTLNTAQAIGGMSEFKYEFSTALKSSVVNTNTTIVCPNTASVIWRVNVAYYTAP